MARKATAVAALPREKDPIKRVLVRIPDSLHHRLRLQAVQNRTTMEAIVRDALERVITVRGGGT